MDRSQRAKPIRLTFNKAAITGLEPPSTGRRYVYDTRVRGLAVCVTARSVRTFYLYRTIEGRPERIRVGAFPAVTIEQARREAVRLLGEIASGRNPQEAKRAARAEMRFGELFKLYLDGHAKPHKRSWRADQRLAELYLTRWQRRRVSEIDHGAVVSLHNWVARNVGPTQANRVLALISMVFTFAQQHGLPGNNPARHVKRFRERSRDRFLDGDELRRFFLALREEGPTWRDFFLTLLLTGARRGNVQGMRWADIDLERGLWRIPASEAKGGEDVLVVLVPEVVAVLQERRQHTSESGYVFPSNSSRSGHVTSPKKVWAHILKRAGLTNLRVHDLRRTLGSWQAAGGSSLPIIGRSLGHKSLTATAVYARLDLDPVRQSVNRAAAAMLAAANGEEHSDEQD